MNCKYSRLLSRYADDELPFEDRDLIQKHIDLCGACRGELDKILKIKKAICQNRISLDPEVFWAGLRGKIDRNELPRADRRVAPALKLAPIAAVAIIVVAVIMSFAPGNKNPVDEYILGTSISNIASLLGDHNESEAVAYFIY